MRLDININALMRQFGTREEIGIQKCILNEFEVILNSVTLVIVEYFGYFIVDSRPFSSQISNALESSILRLKSAAISQLLQLQLVMHPYSLFIHKLYKLGVPFKYAYLNVTAAFGYVAKLYLN